MAKNPFKTKNVVDTIINVGLGGAGNVLADNIIDMAGWDIEEDYKNLGKLFIGAIGSAMVSNRYAKAVMDGFATVGASNYISKLVTSDATPSTTAGVPYGTVGRVRYIAPRSARAKPFSKKLAGVPNGTISEMMN